MTKLTPDPCNCGSRMFTRVFGLRLPDEHDKEDTNEWVHGEGWKCEECGALQLTREIPDAHASDDSLNLPESADRDMVHEDAGDN